MKSKIKYGLFVVTRMNVGDDIQSLAAKRFIPRVDYFIDRDHLDKLEDIRLKKDHSIKMIMNGWYMGGHQFWPPKNPALKPLMTSVHINTMYDGGLVKKAMLSPASVKYLKSVEPIGARDVATLKLLQSKGVESYFSACMTLTLVADSRIKKKEFILAINVSDEVYEKMLERTDRRVVRMDVERTPHTTVEENLAMAKYYLSLYQSAYCVVTTRLHATLPTISVGGKVLFIIEKNNDNPDFEDRFSGLYNLSNNMTAKDFISDAGEAMYDINNPKENPDKYKELRVDLESKSRSYTGFDSEQSYMEGATLDELTTSPDFISALTKISEYSYDAYRYDMKWKVPVVFQEYGSTLNNEIEILHSTLARELNPGVITASKRLGKALLYKTGLKRRN